MELTQQRLKEVLSYDPETGIFIWKVRSVLRPHDKTWNARYSGKKAGYINSAGYWITSIDDRRYLNHRLAWMYMTGSFPLVDVDHIGGDPLDNRWGNLREATRSNNLANAKRHVDSTSGLKGATWEKWTGKWRAVICVNGKTTKLGRYNTAEEAHEVYWKAAQELRGRFARKE